MTESIKPAALRAVPMTLYPTLGSLQEVIDMATAQLPLVNKNTVHSVLMTYHNTLLLQQVRENPWN